MRLDLALLLPPLLPLLLLQTTRWPVGGYRLPTPYYVEAPYSYGRYCNASDPSWWEGFLFVDKFGAIRAAENSTLQTDWMDSVELLQTATLNLETFSSLTLNGWCRLSSSAELTLLNWSSLAMEQHSSLELTQPLTLRQDSRLELRRYSSARIDGRLRLGRGSRLRLSNHSHLLLGPNAVIRTADYASVSVEQFSSLRLGRDSGILLGIDRLGLTLRRHSSIELANDTWIRFSEHFDVPDGVRMLIDARNKDVTLDTLKYVEYMTADEFGSALADCAGSHSYC